MRLVQIIPCVIFILQLASATPKGGAGYTYNVPKPSASDPCDEEQLRRCADNAEPILRSPEYAVPDNARAVSQVCRIWTDLTNCVSNYTRKCMTPFKRIEFEKATRESLASMTGFCSNQDQQDEYLSVAPCVKKLTTQEKMCGKQYNYLIDLVSEGTIKQVCCARAKFLGCLLSKSGCDNRRSGTGNSTNPVGLAVAILDSSLAFMSQRCDTSRFQESDCPGIDGSRTNSKGPLLPGQDPGVYNPGSGSQTHFQLDQGRPTGGVKVSRPGATYKPGTITKEIKERPLSGQLGGQNQRPQNRPAPGGTCILEPHLALATLVTLAVLLVFTKVN